MSPLPSPSLYNQNVLNDEDFVANFVARNDVLDALLRRLSSTAEGDGGLHHLLIGARGMGKTSLLRRVSIAINQDEELAARHIPLRFREEQYNVLTLGDFWRNCGEALAEWAEANGKQDLADRLDAALAGAAWAGEEAAAERFRAETEALQRRAVLLVDNLDLILDALPADANWTLRRYLQAPKGPIMIGAAAHPLKQSGEREAAFYEFFQPHHLEPIGEPETAACMRALAERRGEQGKHVLEVLNKQPERLKTLHTLTGGNPRVLALTYRLLESAETDAAMADLEALLDQVTPYYKARVEEYQTPLQRAVIDAIALNWDPITTGDLATTTNVVSTTLSPLLQKLRKDGLIETVETSGSYSGHQVVERFLNIWYLMRHGTRRTKQKMRWLVGFLTSFYSSHDLAELARRAKAQGFAQTWNADYAFAIEHALARHRPSKENPAGLGGPDLQERVTETLGSSVTKEGGSDADSVLNEALASLNEASALLEAGDLRGLALTLDEILHKFGGEKHPAFADFIAAVLLLKGHLHYQEGHHESEIVTLDELIARYRDSEEPFLRVATARAFVAKGLALGQLGDRAGEIAAYDDLVAQFGQDAEPDVREAVAKALLNKGIELAETEKREIEIAVYDDLVARFGRDEEPALRKLVAKALINKAVTLADTGNKVASIAAYDDLLERYGNDEEPSIRGVVAKAMLGKGVAVGHERDGAAEIAVYEDLVARFGHDTDSTVREQVAKALFNKGIELRRLNEPAAAVAAYDDILARLGDCVEPALRGVVAKALNNKAVALTLSGDSRAGIATCDELLSRFGNDNELVFQQQVAQALINKGLALAGMGEAAAAIAIYDELLSRFGNEADPALREASARALVNKAIELDDIAESATYDDLLTRFGADEDPKIRAQVATGLFHKGLKFELAGRGPAAIPEYERALGLLPPIPGDLNAPLRADASIRLANMLMECHEEYGRAELLYLDAAAVRPHTANGNLAWLYLLSNRGADADLVRRSLEQLPTAGLALIDAAMELTKDNFGAAMAHLTDALSGSLKDGDMDFSDDLERLLRLAEKRGYGERLLAWFAESGFAERVAPIYAAFAAYVRGEKLLLDFNPEVRRPAQVVFERLSAARRHASGTEAGVKQTKRRRGGRNS